MEKLYRTYIIYTNAQVYQEARQTSKVDISAKTIKDLDSLTFLQKDLSQKSGWLPNTYYSIVKFPMYIQVKAKEG